MAQGSRSAANSIPGLRPPCPPRARGLLRQEGAIPSTSSHILKPMCHSTLWQSWVLTPIIQMKKPRLIRLGKPWVTHGPHLGRGQRLGEQVFRAWLGIRAGCVSGLSVCLSFCLAAHCSPNIPLISVQEEEEEPGAELGRGKSVCSGRGTGVAGWIGPGAQRGQ